MEDILGHSSEQPAGPDENDHSKRQLEIEVAARRQSGTHEFDSMNRGALGVQVPHVNTVAHARAAVEAVKLHPEGRRSLAAGTRASDYGFRGTVGDFVAGSESAHAGLRPD